MPAGTRLSPFQLARLAACGMPQVSVRKPLRLTVFSTGDELRDPGQPLADGQIYDANRLLIRHLLAGMPLQVADLGILPDDPARIRTALAAAAADTDVLLTSGGVSVGDADHVRAVVESLGELRFWRIAIKPGKPVAHGRIGRTVFFGLPGNPVSTVVTLLLLVKPALWWLAGGPSDAPPRMSAVLADAIEHSPGRAEFQRGRLEQRAGAAVVQVCGDQSSNRLSSFAGANCLICVPRHAGRLEAGMQVEVLPFSGILG
jgi:molybdopterin molybdotransferase